MEIPKRNMFEQPIRSVIQKATFFMNVYLSRTPLMDKYSYEYGVADWHERDWLDTEQEKLLKRFANKFNSKREAIHKCRLADEKEQRRLMKLNRAKASRLEKIVND